MRKKIFGRQLKRDKNERRALFKSLLSSLVLYESIQTTEAKAKAIKASADKLITKAKKGGLHSFRLVESEISIQAVKKLLNTIAPRFSNRQGGYTRIIRTAKRVKDNAQEVILEWTERATIQKEVVSNEPNDSTKKTNAKQELHDKIKPSNIVKKAVDKKVKGKTK